MSVTERAKLESSADISGEVTGGAAGPPVLDLYSREYCHLCHDMHAQVEALQRVHAFELRIVDVDTDPALEERFGELVPVLMHGALELARYRLDASSLDVYLRARGAAGG